MPFNNLPPRTRSFRLGGGCANGLGNIDRSLSTLIKDFRYGHTIHNNQSFSSATTIVNLLLYVHIHVSEGPDCTKFMSAKRLECITTS